MLRQHGLAIRSQLGAGGMPRHDAEAFKAAVRAAVTEAMGEGPGHIFSLILTRQGDAVVATIEGVERGALGRTPEELRRSVRDLVTQWRGRA